MEKLVDNPPNVPPTLFASAQKHFGEVQDFESLRDWRVLQEFIRSVNHTHYISYECIKGWGMVFSAGTFLAGSILTAFWASGIPISKPHWLGIPLLLLVCAYFVRVTPGLAWNAYSMSGSMNTEKIPEIFDGDLRQKMANFLAENPTAAVSSVTLDGPTPQLLYVRVGQSSYDYHSKRWLCVYIHPGLAEALTEQTEWQTIRNSFQET